MPNRKLTRRGVLGTTIVATVGVAGCAGGEADTGIREGNETNTSDSGEEYDSIDDVDTLEDLGEMNINPEEVREKAEPVEYDELMRNAEDYVGEPLYHEARVDQVLVVEEGDGGNTSDEENTTHGENTSDDENIYQLRLIVNDEYDDVMGFWHGERVIEDDIVETYSVGGGRIEYETLLGERREIPLLYIYDLEILDKDELGNETEV